MRLDGSLMCGDDGYGALSDGPRLILVQPDACQCCDELDNGSVVVRRGGTKRAFERRYDSLNFCG